MNEPFLGWAARSKIEERCKDIMDYVKAFVVGGIICAIVQILMEKTKLMPGRIMVMLVCTGALLALSAYTGHFQSGQAPVQNVPLLGFGNDTVEGCEGGSGQRGLYRLV